MGRITGLQASVGRLRQSNEAVQAELDTERKNYNKLARDTVRMCDEKQQALEEKRLAHDGGKAALLERDLNNLMLDHYRDDTKEKQRMLDAKYVEIARLSSELTNAEAEIQELQDLWQHREICDGETRASTGAGVSTKRPRRRRNRGRKNVPSCCATQSGVPA